jgi:site-specific recombinase XerD
MALVNPLNASILCEFIVAERDEHNLKLSSILTQIKIIYLFNRYLDYRSFEQITKDEVVGYLVSLKKSESQDPTHKWTGTYNTRQMIIRKFFRWLYNHSKIVVGIIDSSGISLCQVTMDSKQDNVRIIRWYMRSH